MKRSLFDPDGFYLGISSMCHIFTILLLRMATKCFIFSTNTRAVPLVRKDDAHQGRVFLFSSNDGHQEEMI
ncbi:MAG: hypothetical protein WCS52_16065 [bacterium]